IIAIHIAIFISRSTFPIRPLRTLRAPQRRGSLPATTLWFTGFRMVAVGSARFIAEKIGRLVVLRLATKKSKSFGGSPPTRVQLKSFHELNAGCISLAHSNRRTRPARGARPELPRLCGADETFDPSVY